MVTRSLESLVKDGEDIEPPDSDLLITDCYICDANEEKGTFALTYLKPNSTLNTDYMVICDFGKKVPPKNLLDHMYFFSSAYKQKGTVKPVKVTARSYMTIKKNGNGNSTLMPKIKGVSKVEIVND